MMGTTGKEGGLVEGAANKGQLQSSVSAKSIAVCCLHPGRKAVLNCLMHRGFCSDCVANVEMRTAGCAYCPLKAMCPIQAYYQDVARK